MDFIYGTVQRSIREKEEVRHEKGDADDTAGPDVEHPHVHWKKKKVFSESSLVALIKKAIQRQTTLFSLARHLGHQPTKNKDILFKREVPDATHPALSFEGEVLGGEKSTRAVLRSQATLWGIPCEIRVLTESTALEQAERRQQILKATDLPIVLTVTVMERGQELPLVKVEQVLRRLNLAVFLGGEVGGCHAERQWCHRRKYLVAAKKGHRPAVVLVELDHPGGQVGGIKIISQRDEF